MTVHPGAPAMEAAPEGTTSPAPVEWSWNPWRERPRPAWIALAASALSAVILLVAGAGPVLAAILTLAVAGMLSPLLLPSHCRVDDTGVAVRGAFGWERRAWSSLRRARPTADGFLVSPFASAHRLDPFRALALPLPASGRSSLAAPLCAHFESHGL